MSSTRAQLQQEVPGFWKRLALAFEAMSESLDEITDRRIARLEAEVRRLSVIAGARAKTSNSGQ